MIGVLTMEVVADDRIDYDFGDDIDEDVDHYDEVHDTMMMVTVRESSN